MVGNGLNTAGLQVRRQYLMRERGYVMKKQARKHPLLSYGMKLSLVNSRAVLIPISYCALFSLQNILAILYQQISQTEF